MLLSAIILYRFFRRCMAEMVSGKADHVDILLPNASASESIAEMFREDAKAL